MKSINEFMAAYFARRREIDRAWLDEVRHINMHYFSDRYMTFGDFLTNEDLLYEDANPPKVLMHTDGDVVEVITVEPNFGSLNRYRYRLKRRGPSWEIDRIATECSSCRGECCAYCGGSGWLNDYD